MRRLGHGSSWRVVLLENEIIPRPWSQQSSTHSTNMALSSSSLTLMSASIFPIPLHVPSARTQFAFVNMNADANHPTRGASVDDIQKTQLRKRTSSSYIHPQTHFPIQSAICRIPLLPTQKILIFFHPKSPSDSTFIDSLWNAPSNQDLVSQFLNNSFCTTCARGTDHDCLPLYQRYSVVRRASLSP